MEWLKSDIKGEEYRVLNISLTNDNIEHFESQSFEETIKEIEIMDDTYYSIVPSFKELLSKYVDDIDNCLYTKKDLYYIYQKRYIQENGLEFANVNDERYCGSIRY